MVQREQLRDSWVLPGQRTRERRQVCWCNISFRLLFCAVLCALPAAITGRKGGCRFALTPVSRLRLVLVVPVAVAFARVQEPPGLCGIPLLQWGLQKAAA